MPDTPDRKVEIVHAIERLLAHGGLGMTPDQRRDVYAQLLVRSGATARPPDHARTGSEFARAEDRDFLRWRSADPPSQRGDVPPTDTVPAVVPGRPRPAPPVKVDATAAAKSDALNLGIMLILRRGTLESNTSLKNGFVKQLQSQLDGELKLMGLSLPFRARVRVEPEKPAADKITYRRMDFPIYVLPPTQDISDIHQVMTEHGVPRRHSDVDLYDLVRRNWDDREVPAYGVTAPPSPRQRSFGKAAFVSYDRVSSKCFGSLSNCLANVALHELFHLFGFTRHSQTGLMTRSRPSDVPVSLDARSRVGVSGQLVQLYLEAIKP